MATLSNDIYTTQLKLDKDPFETVKSVLIGAACALEGVSAVLSEVQELSTSQAGNLAYAADESVCLQRRLLNTAAETISGLQAARDAAKRCAGEGS